MEQLLLGDKKFEELNVTVSSRIHLLVMVYWILALAVISITAMTESVHINLWALSVFVLAVWLAESMPILVAESVGITISTVIHIAVLLSLGPVEATIVGIATGMAFFPLKQIRERLIKIVFNMAQMGVAVGVAAIVYTSLHGPVGVLSADRFPYVLIPLAAAVGTLWFLNGISVGMAIGLSTNTNPLRHAVDILREMRPLNYVALSLMGIMLSQVYGLLGFTGVLLLAIPLIVSRQVYDVYIKHKGAYIDALGALVGALEAKDRYTRGHSERVAKLAVKTGKAMNLPAATLDDLRMAGLLHDIGKISIKGLILRKPGGLTSDEFEIVKSHPRVGADIVGNIKLLKNAIGGIAFHHERNDGTGYHALTAHEIPLTAKILCVTDAYDSMTSRRSYREAVPAEDAFEELRRCAGTQFDPDIVDCFISAVGDSS